MIWRMIAAALLATTIPSLACAQAERYELGRRLREFERAWEKADVINRKRSVGPLKDSVNAFFTFRYPERVGSSPRRGENPVNPPQPCARARLDGSGDFGLPGRFLDPTLAELRTFSDRNTPG